MWTQAIPSTFQHFGAKASAARAQVQNGQTNSWGTYVLQCRQPCIRIHTHARTFFVSLSLSLSHTHTHDDINPVTHPATRTPTQSTSASGVQISKNPDPEQFQLSTLQLKRYPPPPLEIVICLCQVWCVCMGTRVWKQQMRFLFDRSYLDLIDDEAQKKWKQKEWKQKEWKQNEPRSRVLVMSARVFRRMQGGARTMSRNSRAGRVPLAIVYRLLLRRALQSIFFPFSIQTI